MCSYVIETKRLTKKYGEQTAVNAVNIHVEKGRIYGLVGSKRLPVKSHPARGGFFTLEAIWERG